MDRSRLILALALALSLVSVVLGLLQIVITGKNSGFQNQEESFFNSGKAGVAKIPVYGVIIDDLPGSHEVSADSLIDQLEDARTSTSVRAILLVINSPGGSVGAVKKVYNKIIQVKTEKPVVAVVTDIAASGGYYLAAAADRIFAYEGSILGSIGVIAYRPDYSGIMNRYGVKMEAIKAGAHKDFLSPFRPMQEEERAMFQSVLDDAYLQFLNDVAEGRGQALSTVRNWAEGKVFSGKQAKAEQIIDDLGGEPEAIEALKLMLKTSKDLPIFEREPDWFDIFTRSLGGSGSFPFTNSQLSACNLPVRPGALYVLPGAGLCLPVNGVGGL